MSDLEIVKNRILAKVPLASLIGEVVSLSNRGGHPTGLCPFHQEKSPSFYVYDQRYYCFGCKEHGDAINFVRKTMGLSFLEALRHLAEKYGVDAQELQKNQGEWQRFRTEKSLYQVMAEAQGFFARELFTPRGEDALLYLRNRGFSEEHIKKWGFGLTPEESYGLVRYLRQRGHNETQLIDLSLATPAREVQRKPYDFFRHRIMIPIHDIQGRIIAFGGRATDQDPAKYKNSRETALFSKSEVLFGLHEARHHIRSKGRAIVVEGYMDALRLWSAGFQETIACMGTALTPIHMQRLKAMTGLVLLVFDGDEAGKKATLKAVDVALGEPSVTVRAVRLPQGLDPDDYLNKNGPESFENLLGESSYLLDFAVKDRLSGLYPHQAARALQDEILPWLAKIANPLLRDSLVVRIANQMGTSRETLLSQLPSEKDLRAHHELNKLGVGSGLSEKDSASDPKARLKAFATSAPENIEKLPPALLDLVGHLYLAAPEEFHADSEKELQRIKAAVFNQLELPEIVQFFIDEILDALGSGHRPSTLPPEHWRSLVSPAIAALRDKILRRREAFQCASRVKQIERVLLHFKLEKTKKTIASLRSEMSKMVRLGGKEAPQAELVQIMKSIKAMEDERLKIHQSLMT